MGCRIAGEEKEKKKPHYKSSGVVYLHPCLCQQVYLNVDGGSAGVNLVVWGCLRVSKE